LKQKKKISTGFDRLLYGMGFSAAMLLFLLVLLIGASVFSRKLFNEPMAWTIEIGEYSLVLIVFLSLAWVLKEGGHIKVDFLFDRFKPRTKVLVEAISHGLGAITWLTIGFYAALNSVIQMQRNVFLIKTLSVPMWVMLVIISAGSLILGIQLIRAAFNYAKIWIAFPNTQLDSSESSDKSTKER